MKRNLELPGRILLSWFTAGALTTGGALVAYGLFSERITHYYLLYTIAILYTIGGLIGIFFGGALGMFGRPLQMKINNAFKDQMTGLLYTLPIGGAAFVVAGWMGLTYWAVYSMNIVAIGFVTVSWLIFALVFALALEYGWFGLKNVSARIKKLFGIRLRIEFDNE